MDNPSFTGYPGKNLNPGEKVVYQSPRNWVLLINPMFYFLFVLILGAVYFFLSYWLQNLVTNIQELPVFASQVNIDTAKFINILCWVLLCLAGLFLISGIVQVAAFAAGKITLTDQRILSRTSGTGLRKINIALDRISWVDFPNLITSKGPVRITTRDGKNTALRNLAKPEIFLGLFENCYPAEARPVINRKTIWAALMGKLILLGMAAAGLYIAFYSPDTVSRIHDLVVKPTPTPHRASSAMCQFEIVFPAGWITGDEDISTDWYYIVAGINDWEEYAYQNPPVMTISCPAEIPSSFEWDNDVMIAYWFAAAYALGYELTEQDNIAQATLDTIGDSHKDTPDSILPTRLDEFTVNGQRAIAGLLTNIQADSGADYKYVVTIEHPDKNVPYVQFIFYCDEADWVSVQPVFMQVMESVQWK
jgi:hypothetical protein